MLDRDTALSNMQHSHKEELKHQRALQDSLLDELQMQAADLHAQLALAQQDRDQEASQAHALTSEVGKKEAECKENQERI